MEMAFRLQSSLCPRSRPMLVIQPADSSGGGLMQPFLTTERFGRCRIVQCLVENSDSPNRKYRRTVSPQIKVTSSRGYAPRLIAESSIKKREHSNNDEKRLGTYNRLLSVDVKEWTTTREVETVEVDLSQNASSSSIVREMDAVKEDIFEVDLIENALNNVITGEMNAVDENGVEEDIFETELSGTALSSAGMSEVVSIDEAGVEEDIFEVDLLEVSLSSPTIERVDAVNEVRVVQGTFEADLSGNVSGDAIMGELDMVDNAVDGYRTIQDTFVPDLLSNVSSGTTMWEVDAVDKAGVVQQTFDVNLSGNVSNRIIMEEVDVVDEVRVLQDTSGADLPENISSSATCGEVNVVGEVEIVQNAFVIDLSGNDSSKATMWEVDTIDKDGANQDTFEIDSSGNILSSATNGKVEVVVDTMAVLEKFDVHLSGNPTYGEVDVTDETTAEEVIFQVDFSENTSSSARLWGMDEADEKARAKEETFHMDLLGSVSDNRRHTTVDSVGEAITEEETYQRQYPALSSTSIMGKTIDRTPACSNPEHMPLVRVQEQGKSTFSIHDQEGIVTFHKKHHSMVVYHDQEQLDISFDKQNQQIVKFLQQDQFIAALNQQNLSNIASHEQDRSIVDIPEKNQSIIGPRKQDELVVHVLGQIHSIVTFIKQDQSIVAFRKQNQSIVSVPKQKQSIVSFHKQDISIVGFHKQNLSIVGTSGEGQRKQVAIIGRHDALHVKEVEDKDNDYMSQKTDGDTLHAKFDVDNLLQKHKIDRSEVAMKMSTSKTVDEEHLSMPEEQISTAEEQKIFIDDGISIIEVGMEIGDKTQHVLSNEELSWAEDEVGIIEDDVQYEVDDISMSVEPDIQESTQDYVNPQALRRMLQELVDKNYSTGTKLFIFPEVVKADSVIDLYLNRDLTALASEPDVVIKGAFNGWRWRPFTERLHKSELGGDWWSCKLYIPKEAYRLDFVFFNGRLVYENNENNDFVIEIESTMDETLFEDFLVKEKQCELEKLAFEEAKRRTQTEEQRRREEDRAVDEAIRAQVKAEVEKKKNKLRNMLGLAKTCADNLWYIDASTSRSGNTVRLYYKRNSRPLVLSTEIWMHGGYNNWTDGLSIVERLVECDDKDGDWWYADVTTPEKALVLDWVFADGPPGNAKNYDNNGQHDFHALLLNIMTEEDYWVDEEQCIYTRLLQERREREEAIKIKAERRAKMKAEMKAKTMRRFLLSQKHVVYTEPLEIRAGTTIDVLYNPCNTVLNGKPEVWFRCCFNLWMHPCGGLPPQKMVKAKDGSLLKATVSVPPDAYMMDFVFSESEEGGIYDDRNGMDYHIPVSDSIGTETRMHIVHIAVEMAPIAKVGGLGDVVTSLSRAVQDLGHTVDVILPKYDCMNQSCVKNLHLYRSFSWGDTEVKVWVGLVEDLTVYFLEPQNGMFGVGCVYGRNDDRRFGFFCHSALEFILQNGSSPHIIHCHDWSSAPVAWLYKEHYAQSRLASARVVFTIHNLEFGAHYIGKAMTYCDKATTVSYTYSREVAGHGAIAPHRGKFYGIINGIDPDIWDPYTDNFIPVPYTSENVVEGKNAAKRALQQKLGLQQIDVPLVGIVTRLTAQKGIHLIKHAIHRTLESNGQVVLLGSAPDPRIQGDFCRLADSLHGVYHGQVKLVLTYDEPLSHLIYAGSDFVLVPSIFEPCGLTQLVAMRYGSIPIVRRTGGLYDTVFDVDHDKDRARSLGLEPNGFSFDGADSNGVDYAMNRAITAWFDAREWFHSLCKRVMEQDWSWNRPALDYIELYHSARKF